MRLRMRLRMRLPQRQAASAASSGSVVLTPPPLALSLRRQVRRCLVGSVLDTRVGPALEKQLHESCASAHRRYVQGGVADPMAVPPLMPHCVDVYARLQQRGDRLGASIKCINDLAQLGSCFGTRDHVEDLLLLSHWAAEILRSLEITLFVR